MDLPSRANHNRLAYFFGKNLFRSRKSGAEKNRPIKSLPKLLQNSLQHGVAPGKVDIARIDLDADPTRDIRNTRRIRAVVFDGRLLQRADLDALLTEAATH